VLRGRLFKAFAFGRRGVIVGRWGRGRALVLRVPSYVKGFGALMLDVEDGELVAVFRYIYSDVPVDVGSTRVVVVDLDDEESVREFRLPLPCGVGRVPGPVMEAVCNEQLLHVLVAGAMVSEGLVSDAYLEVQTAWGDIDIVGERSDGYVAVEVKPWFCRDGEDEYIADQEVKGKVWYYRRAGYYPFNLAYASMCGGRPDIAAELAERYDLGLIVIDHPFNLRVVREIKSCGWWRKAAYPRGAVSISRILGPLLDELRAYKRSRRR